MQKYAPVCLNLFLPFEILRTSPLACLWSWDRPPGPSTTGGCCLCFVESSGHCLKGNSSSPFVNLSSNKHRRILIPRAHELVVLTQKEAHTSSHCLHDFRHTLLSAYLVCGSVPHNSVLRVNLFTCIPNFWSKVRAADTTGRYGLFMLRNL